MIIVYKSIGIISKEPGQKDDVSYFSHLISEASQMTDSERDQIDNEAEQIIRMCRETISMFRKEANASRVHPQVREHRQAVMALIEAYLKGTQYWHQYNRTVC